MNEQDWYAELTSYGVDGGVAAEEARTLAGRYSSGADIDAANGPGAYENFVRRLLERSYRPTASAGGIGGDADLDENALIDPGWYAFESDAGEFRFSRSADPASVGLSALVPSQWAYWGADDRVAYIDALEARWATLPGRPAGDLTIPQRRAWIESLIETPIARPVINAGGLLSTVFRETTPTPQYSTDLDYDAPAPVFSFTPARLVGPLPPVTLGAGPSTISAMLPPGSSDGEVFFSPTTAGSTSLVWLLAAGAAAYFMLKRG